MTTETPQRFANIAKICVHLISGDRLVAIWLDPLGFNEMLIRFKQQVKESLEKLADKMHSEYTYKADKVLPRPNKVLFDVAHFVCIS